MKEIETSAKDYYENNKELLRERAKNKNRELQYQKTDTICLMEKKKKN